MFLLAVITISVSLSADSAVARSMSDSASLRPNIIVVLVDDMGFTDLGCFGGPGVTPNINQLAQEGIRFRNFYVAAPICSPSRTALMTGQYPHRLRITSYLDNRKRNHERGVAQWLDAKTPTMADRLKAAGYATGHFGKWHMGGQRDVGDAPLISEYGFDASLTNFEGLGPRVLPLNDAYDGKPAKPHDLGSSLLGHGPVRWADRSTVTKEYVGEAIQFISKSNDEGVPFFINLWPDDVHSPFFPPAKLRSQTDNSKQELYYAVLESMDRQLGELFDYIRTNNQLRNNTLIVFASDNGHEQGAGQSTPLRGGKTWLYEGGIRSPLIVWGPGLVEPTTASTVNATSVICAMDLHRSLVSLSGVPLESDEVCDGELLIETLLGRSEQSRQRPIFWRRPPDRPGTADEDNPDLAVRDGRWKLLMNYDGSDVQLYDLIADEAEQNNLAQQNPDIAARLIEATTAWNTTMPVDAGNPTFRLSPVSLSANEFVNPVAEGADPWVIRDPNSSRYLWSFSEGNRSIAIYVGEKLASPGTKHVVWTAPSDVAWSKEVWAPELHFLDGRWHIYFAASDGRNANHLAYVLKSKTEDPLGDYELHGPLATGDGSDGKSPNIWAIDMTVLQHQKQRFAIWSGWDAPGTDQQFLYIAPMKSPTELAGARIRLCANDDFDWELTEPLPHGRGLNEAPQVVQHNGRTFLLYSCGASWLPNYKLGMLELIGDDPMAPSSWKKFDEPVFQGTNTTYGVGHSCVVPSPDQTEWWHVFHAKRDREPGWARAVFVQPMKFGPKGMPQFGNPVKAAVPLRRPSGEPATELQLPWTKSLRSAADMSHGSYFGHHQFIATSDQGLELGVPTARPINDYRSGEKFVLHANVPRNMSAEVTIEFLSNTESRDAGLLFRTTGPSIGYDAQRGYFAGLIPKTGLVILGRTDGSGWTEISRSSTVMNLTEQHRLRVTAVGDQLMVHHNDRLAISVRDSTWESGTVGVRVVDTHARFSNLHITSETPPP